VGQTSQQRAALGAGFTCREQQLKQLQASESNEAITMTMIVFITLGNWQAMYYMQ